MKRLVAAVLAAVLGVSLAGFEGATASPGTPARAGYTPSISFTSCGGDRCANFVVPRDWDDRDGPKITLAVRMRVHTSPTSKGLLLVNPGGPGGSGTGMVGLAGIIPGGVGNQYDVVGWDPRGVGSSAPALRCDSGYFGTDRPSFVPRTKKLMRFWKKKADRYAARCGASAARTLLPHMTTMDNVQDMEALRQALAGSGKLNFYGFSYGSYLGQVYATRYPANVGRFVFDGVVDPATYWYRANLRQERGFDRNLNVFFRWVAKHPGAYHLGRDWRKIRRGYDRMLGTLDRRPSARGRLGPDELTDAMLNAGYYVFYWDQLATAYSMLVRRGAGRAMFAFYRDTNMGDDNGYAVYLGTQCTDARRPGWRTQVRDAWRIHRKDPFLAWDNTWYNAPCRRWPAPSVSPTRVSGVAARAAGGRFLLVNETLDAATPFSGALRVRSLFPSASLIEGVGGTTHAGSLNGVGCVDGRIATFLGNGALPVRLSGVRADVACPAVRPPSAIGAVRVTARASGTGAALRRELVAAQLTGR